MTRDKIVSVFEKELHCYNMDAVKCSHVECSECEYFHDGETVYEAIKAAVDILKEDLKNGAELKGVKTMNLEKVKEAVNNLEKYRKCMKVHCDGVCPKCSYNFTQEDMDNSIDTAITVINDVIKTMERLKNEQG